MDITQTIAAYEEALTIERSLQAEIYQCQKYYEAISRTNKLRYQMLNHPDWTIELQEKHYPTLPGEIPYPVSC